MFQHQQFYSKLVELLENRSSEPLILVLEKFLCFVVLQNLHQSEYHQKHNCSELLVSLHNLHQKEIIQFLDQNLFLDLEQNLQEKFTQVLVHSLHSRVLQNPVLLFQYRKLPISRFMVLRLQLTQNLIKQLDQHLFTILHIYLALIQLTMHLVQNLFLVQQIKEQFLPIKEKEILRNLVVLLNLHSLQFHQKLFFTEFLEQQQPVSKLYTQQHHLVNLLTKEMQIYFADKHSLDLDLYLQSTLQQLHKELHLLSRQISSKLVEVNVIVTQEFPYLKAVKLILLVSLQMKRYYSHHQEFLVR